MPKEKIEFIDQGIKVHSETGEIIPIPNFSTLTSLQGFSDNGVLEQARVLVQ